MKPITHDMTWGSFTVTQGSFVGFSKYSGPEYVCRILGGYGGPSATKPRRGEVFRGPMDDWLSAISGLADGDYKLQVIRLSSRRNGVVKDSLSITVVRKKKEA